MLAEHMYILCKLTYLYDMVFIKFSDNIISDWTLAISAQGARQLPEVGTDSDKR